MFHFDMLYERRQVPTSYSKFAEKDLPRNMVSKHSAAQLDALAISDEIFGEYSEEW